MQSQKSNEESERRVEIQKDWQKARQFPRTIIGRKRLRYMRKALWSLGIFVHIPMNSAHVTDQYCIDYGKEETWEERT